jgi:hypothetical protein
MVIFVKDQLSEFDLNNLFERRIAALKVALTLIENEQAEKRKENKHDEKRTSILAG